MIESCDGLLFIFRVFVQLSVCHRSLSPWGPRHQGLVTSRSCPAVSEDKWSIRQLLNFLHHHHHPPPLCLLNFMGSKTIVSAVIVIDSVKGPRIAACGDSFLDISWWSMKCLWTGGVLFYVEDIWVCFYIFSSPRSNILLCTGVFYASPTF